MRLFVSRCCDTKISYNLCSNILIIYVILIIGGSVMINGDLLYDSQHTTPIYTNRFGRYPTEKPVLIDLKEHQRRKTGNNGKTGFHKRGKFLFP